MTIAEYLEAVKDRLLTDPLVTGLEVLRERSTSTDGHMRVRLALDDHSQLEFSEYVQRSAEGQINTVTYSYHWSDAQGQLIRRWDNTPHFPTLDGFPHHVHTGPADTVAPSQPVNIFAVLDIIGQLIHPT